MGVVLAEGLPEWFSALMYSKWLYIFVGGLFLVVLLCGTIGLLFHRRDKPARPTSIKSRANGQFDWTTWLQSGGKLNGKAHSVLLAGGKVCDLPVTIAVNAAIQLAASCRCLLIDLDTERDALARVFEMAPQPGSPSPQPTPIDNVDIWPAHLFSQLQRIDRERALGLAEHQYDVILLYAPYVANLPDRGRVIRWADSAVVFASDKQSTKALRHLLKAGSCNILKTNTSATRTDHTAP